MLNRQGTFYLTLRGPRRGERVIASVKTDDRVNAEILFGCGIMNDKGFCFDGLYTEEEVLHMFKPHTDIAGTFNPMTGSCELHKDYHRVPGFEVENGKVYQVRNGELCQLDMTEKNNDFEHVRLVVAGKIQPLSKGPVPSSGQPTLSYEYDPSEDYDYMSDDSIEESSGNETYSEPDFDDVVEPEFDDEPDVSFTNVTQAATVTGAMSDVYSALGTEQKAGSKAGDEEFLSSFDSLFYGAQKDVASQAEFQGKPSVQKYFVNGTDRSVRKQGQSLRDLFEEGLKS